MKKKVVLIFVDSVNLVFYDIPLRYQKQYSTVDSHHTLVVDEWWVMQSSVMKHKCHLE